MLGLWKISQKTIDNFKVECIDINWTHKPFEGTVFLHFGTGTIVGLKGDLGGAQTCKSCFSIRRLKNMSINSFESARPKHSIMTIFLALSTPWLA